MSIPILVPNGLQHIKGLLENSTKIGDLYGIRLGMMHIFLQTGNIPQDEEDLYRNTFLSANIRSQIHLDETECGIAQKLIKITQDATRKLLNEDVELVEEDQADADAQALIEHWGKERPELLPMLKMVSDGLHGLVGSLDYQLDHPNDNIDTVIPKERRWTSLKETGQSMLWMLNDNSHLAAQPLLLKSLVHKLNEKRLLSTRQQLELNGNMQERDMFLASQLIAQKQKE